MILCNISVTDVICSCRHVLCSVCFEAFYCSTANEFDRFIWLKSTHHHTSRTVHVQRWYHAAFWTVTSGWYLIRYHWTFYGRIRHLTVS